MLEQGAEYFDRQTRLLAICSLDGRYRDKTQPLANYVNEYGLIATRLEIEAAHLVKLCEVGSQLSSPLGRSLNESERQFLLNLGPNLTIEQAVQIKEVEDSTNHDVAAMVQVFKELVVGTSMEDLVGLVHFPLTSEDINNLAYRLMTVRVRDQILVLEVDNLINDLLEMTKEYKDDPMLARTHGQSAQGTTLGHEMVVFAKRLNRQNRKLETQVLTGKFNGAVGNFNAHIQAVPEIDWIKYSREFVSSLGFEPELVTTQINPYDDLIELFQTVQRINGVVVDFDQNLWRYISDDWFTQIPKKEEIGSSAMPQKINPIYFERSEGNGETAVGILEGMSRKLSRSRLQRDLSDSTTIRNIGLGLGFSLLSYINCREGFGRVYPNTELMFERLSDEWATLSEIGQVVMRREGVANSYDLAKNLARGQKLDQSKWQEWVENMPISEEAKLKLSQLSPEINIGLAEKIVEIALEEIAASKQG